MPREGELAAAGEAMQHGREGALPGFLVAGFSRDVVVGLAGVDHQRQAGLAGGRDMGAEALLLRVARRVVVVVVEPRLADRHHLGMAASARPDRPCRCRVPRGRGADACRPSRTRPGNARRWPADRPAGAPGSRSSPCGRCRPPARAPTTPSSSSLKSGKSRWQWLSTSMAVTPCAASGST